MKPYRGKVEVDCMKGKKDCPRKIPGNSVLVDCPNCHMARIRIVDLEGKVLFELPPIPAPKVKTAKKKSK